MTSSEFLARVKRYARRNGLECRFDRAHGKGGQGRLHLGSRFTTVKRGEIGPGLLAAMLKQLNTDKRDFRPCVTPIPAT